MFYAHPQRLSTIANRNCTIFCMTRFAHGGGVFLALAAFWPLSDAVTAIVLAVIGFAVVIVGALKSYRYVCEACGNRVAEREAKICPTCKEPFAGMVTR